MIHPTMKNLTLVSMCALVCLGFATPVSAAPKEQKQEPKPGASAAASPAASPAEARPFPFKNTVAGVDKAGRTVNIGKATVHKIHVLPETKITKGNNEPAVLEEIIVGEEIRGAVRKRADGDWEALSIKIGPKAVESASPAPAVGASPAPKAKKQ